MKSILFLLIILCITSCIDQLIDWVEPIPPPFENPSEVVVDTCSELIYHDDTAFTVITLWFINGKPLQPKWRWNQTSIVADSMHHLLMLLYPQYDYTYYEEETAITVIVDGVTNNSLFQGKILSEDAIGQRALATAFGRSLFFYGSVKPVEAYYEADHRLNTTGITLTNTDGWTTDEKDTFARKNAHFPICKHGENFAILTGATQSVKDSYDLFLWLNVSLQGSYEIKS